MTSGGRSRSRGRGGFGEGGSSVYRRDLEVPGRDGLAHQVTIPVRPAGWAEAEVSLRGGGLLATMKAPLDPPGEALLQALAIGPGGPPAEFLEGPREQAPPDPAVSLRRLPAARAPAEPLAYAAFDLVILGGTSLRDAPPEAVGALREWVDRGGTLVAFPGPEWSAGVPPGFDGLLGATADPQPQAPARAAAEVLGPLLARGIWQRLSPGPPPARWKAAWPWRRRWAPGGSSPSGSRRRRGSPPAPALPPSAGSSTGPATGRAPSRAAPPRRPLDWSGRPRRSSSGSRGSGRPRAGRWSSASAPTSSPGSSSPTSSSAG